MSPIALVRAPYTYRYNSIDVREEVILTQLSHYLREVGVDHDIHDFHLERDTTVADILAADPSTIVIAVRETGDNVHYALRLAGHLAGVSSAQIVLYGQTARLRDHPLVPRGVKLVAHSEADLAQVLGLPTTGPAFADALRVAPYHDRLPLADWQKLRLRGTIETSRGCPFPCAFCFINAGRNHGRRWQRQSIDATLESLATYVDLGVRAFVFHDSEFMGGTPSDIAHRVALVGALRSGGPQVYFKIYSRADTILKFPDLDKLHEAGLVSVFMGVESFVQSDLDRLQKRLSVAAIHDAVRALSDRGIYMDLSFILFHRCTTIATLRQNLEAILALYASDRARLLGMPHFTFSFESTWRAAATRELSGRTYVGWDVGIKAPAAAGAVFDVELEPLMEVYRLLAYEWSKKVVALNLARDDAADGEREAIERWFQGLGAFCARTMLAFLDDFEDGKLTLGSLDPAREQLFRRVGDYHGVLPLRLRGLATFAEHAGRLDYADEVALVEPDEYWSAQIPGPGPHGLIGAAS